MRNFTEKDLENEKWESMYGYENYCEASTLGRIKVLQRFVPDKNGKIKNMKEKILVLGYYSNGYEQFSISINNIRHTGIVHRLIAKTFIPNLKNKLEVNHINGIKDDNRVSNLEWNTRQENITHAVENLPRNIADQRGDKNSNSKVSEKDVLDIRKRYADKEKIDDIFKDYYTIFALSSLKKICCGSSWKHLL